MTRRKIDLVFFDAGGGHRNAMQALAEVLGKAKPHWHVEPVNLQQLLLSVDPVFSYDPDQIGECLQRCFVARLDAELAAVPARHAKGY